MQPYQAFKLLNLQIFTFLSKIILQAEEIPTMLLPPINPKTQGKPLGLSSQVQANMGMIHILFMDI